MQHTTEPRNPDQTAGAPVPLSPGDVDRPERPSSVELRPGDLIVDWNDFTKFEVVSTAPTRDLFYGHQPDGTYVREDGVLITGRDLKSSETVHRLAGESHRWDWVPAELLPVTSEPTPVPLSPEALAANAAFVAGARTDVPALLAEVDRLREALAAARARVDELEPCFDCGHRASQHAEDGETECTGSRFGCTCAYFIPADYVPSEAAAEARPALAEDGDHRG